MVPIDREAERLDLGEAARAELGEKGVEAVREDLRDAVETAREEMKVPAGLSGTPDLTPFPSPSVTAVLRDAFEDLDAVTFASGSSIAYTPGEDGGDDGLDALRSASYAAVPDDGLPAGASAVGSADLSTEAMDEATRRAAAAEASVFEGMAAVESVVHHADPADHSKADRKAGFEALNEWKAGFGRIQAETDPDVQAIVADLPRDEVMGVDVTRSAGDLDELVVRFYPESEITVRCSHDVAEAVASVLGVFDGTFGE